MAAEAKTDATIVDWLGYLALRCIICTVQSLPLEVCDRGCHLLSVVLGDWFGVRRGTLDENLDRVYGQISERDKSRLRRAMWHHLFLMVCEIAHGPRKIHRTNWRDHIYMPDKAAMLRVMMDPRATVLVTGHFGNFEIAGFACGMLGLPTSTMARPLDNVYVDDYVHRFRSMNGQFILPKEGSSNAVQDLLAEGGSLAILADQHAGGKGVWIDVFGHPTSCHKGLALFVLSAEAPMVVNYNRRLGRPLRFEMGMTGLADPELLKAESVPEYLQSVTDLTEWYNDRLEQAIRLAPEQYWWLHRRWRDVPEKQLRRLQKRRAKKQASASPDVRKAA